MYSMGVMEGQKTANLARVIWHGCIKMLLMMEQTRSHSFPNRS